MKKHYAYPNPVENILNLQLNDDQNKITLSDVLGKIHYVDVVNADYTFNMSGYQSGIYFLRVENSFGIQNLKIIKK
jgi:hypothetical protein